MSGKRKPVLQTRSVEDDSLTEEDDQGHVVAVLVSPYDNVSSPDSTASGPTYAPRRPGFEHHAHHEPTKKRNAEIKTKKILETPPLVKKGSKREPLPMKLRALPQSFWQQPNQPTNVSPAFPVLPPLSVQPRDAGARGEGPEETAHEALLVSPANTELLFSLFRGIEENEGPPPPPVVRRGRYATWPDVCPPFHDANPRPRKAPSTLMARVLKDDDPCLGSAAGHEALPLLMPPLQPSCPARVAHNQITTAMLNECSSLSLPALSGVDHSYSQILSELVFRL